MSRFEPVLALSVVPNCPNWGISWHQRWPLWLRLPEIFSAWYIFDMMLLIPGVYIPFNEGHMKVGLKWCLVGSLIAVPLTIYYDFNMFYYGPLLASWLGGYKVEWRRQPDTRGLCSRLLILLIMCSLYLGEFLHITVNYLLSRNFKVALWKEIVFWVSSVIRYITRPVLLPAHPAYWSEFINLYTTVNCRFSGQLRSSAFRKFVLWMGCVMYVYITRPVFPSNHLILHKLLLLLYILDLIVWVRFTTC